MIRTIMSAALAAAIIVVSVASSVPGQDVKGDVDVVESLHKHIQANIAKSALKLDADHRTKAKSLLEHYMQAYGQCLETTSNKRSFSKRLNTFVLRNNTLQASPALIGHLLRTGNRTEFLFGSILLAMLDQPTLDLVNLMLKGSLQGNPLDIVGLPLYYKLIIKNLSSKDRRQLSHILLTEHLDLEKFEENFCQWGPFRTIFGLALKYCSSSEVIELAQLGACKIAEDRACWWAQLFESQLLMLNSTEKISVFCSKCSASKKYFQEAVALCFVRSYEQSVKTYPQLVTGLIDYQSGTGYLCDKSAKNNPFIGEARSLLAKNDLSVGQIVFHISGIYRFLKELELQTKKMIPDQSDSEDSMRWSPSQSPERDFQPIVHRHLSSFSGRFFNRSHSRDVARLLDSKDRSWRPLSSISARITSTALSEGSSHKILAGPRQMVIAKIHLAVMSHPSVLYKNLFLHYLCPSKSEAWYPHATCIARVLHADGPSTKDPIIPLLKLSSQTNTSYSDRCRLNMFDVAFEAQDSCPKDCHDELFLRLLEHPMFEFADDFQIQALTSQALNLPEKTRQQLLSKYDAIYKNLAIHNRTHPFVTVFQSIQNATPMEDILNIQGQMLN